MRWYCCQHLLAQQQKHQVAPQLAHETHFCFIFHIKSFYLLRVIIMTHPDFSRSMPTSQLYEPNLALE